MKDITPTPSVFAECGKHPGYNVANCLMCAFEKQQENLNEILKPKK